MPFSVTNSELFRGLYHRAEALPASSILGRGAII